MKHCHSCSTDRHESEFWRCAKRPDGLQTQCKSCKRRGGAEWREANPEKARGYVNACAAKNREARRAAAKTRYWSDVEASRVAAREIQARRKPQIAAYMRNQRASRPSVALRQRVSAQIRYCLGSGKGGAATLKLIGYPIAELRTHLERQFVKGMTWENMGDWHIDHIIPLASFAITGPDDPELRRAWALPNLRPLWAADNIAKKDKRTSLL